mgnify:CR=1 FL=1
MEIHKILIQSLIKKGQGTNGKNFNDLFGISKWSHNIIVIVYLYKIKKREKFFPKLDDPQLETGIKIIGGVLLAGVLVFCTIPAGMDIPNMIHEDYLYIEGEAISNSPEDTRYSRAVTIENEDEKKITIEIVGACSDVTYGDKLALKYLPHSKVGFVVKHETVE